MHVRSPLLAVLVVPMMFGCSDAPPRRLRVDTGGRITPVMETARSPRPPFVLRPPLVQEEDTVSGYVSLTARMQGPQRRRDVVTSIANIVRTEVVRFDLELATDEGATGKSSGSPGTEKLVLFLTSDAALAVVPEEADKATLTKLSASQGPSPFTLPRLAPRAAGRMLTLRGTFRLLPSDEREVALGMLSGAVSGGASVLPGGAVVTETLKGLLARTEKLDPQVGPPMMLSLMEPETCRARAATCEGELKTQTLLLAEKAGDATDAEFARQHHYGSDGSLFNKKSRKPFDGSYVLLDVSVERLPDELFDGPCRQWLSVGGDWGQAGPGSLVAVCGSPRLSTADRSRIQSLLAPLDQLLARNGGREERALALAELNNQLGTQCGTGSGQLPQSSLPCREAARHAKEESRRNPFAVEYAAAWAVLEKGLRSVSNLTPESTDQRCDAYVRYKVQELASVGAFLAVPVIKREQCVLNEDWMPMMRCESLPLASKLINASREARQKLAEGCRWDNFLEQTEPQALKNASASFQLAVKGVRDLGASGHAENLSFPASTHLILDPQEDLESVAAAVFRLSDPDGILPSSALWGPIQGHLPGKLQAYRERQQSNVKSASVFAEELKQKLVAPTARLTTWLEQTPADKQGPGLKLQKRLNDLLSMLVFKTLYVPDPEKREAWMARGELWRQLSEGTDDLREQISHLPPPPSEAPQMQSTALASNP